MSENKDKLTKFAAIKKFFSVEGKPVTFDELKALSSEEREELAILSAEALGVELAEMETSTAGE